MSYLTISVKFARDPLNIVDDTSYIVMAILQIAKFCMMPLLKMCFLDKFLGKAVYRYHSS